MHIESTQVPPAFEQFCSREGSTALHRFLRCAQTLFEQLAATSVEPPAISERAERYGLREDPVGASANDKAPTTATTTRKRTANLTVTLIPPPCPPVETRILGSTGLGPKIAGPFNRKPARRAQKP